MEGEQLTIRDVAMAAESQSKEGDSFFLITHRSPCSLTDFTLSTSNSFDSRCIRRSGRISIQIFVVFVVDDAPIMFCANSRLFFRFPLAFKDLTAFLYKKMLFLLLMVFQPCFARILGFRWNF
ncbi:hypothetical protein Syun_011290 [Stephania yunnanensis]|uniref:Uncharacterized protein n=1 Tax=Stephania yunnanensis TaxID=152371 RepID=A0AAP0JY99_9MAGN